MEAFTYQLKVRDYECDMQGIVNNAVYQNYLETARHEFLHSRGLSFAQLTKEGVIIVVVRAEIDYRQPLRAEDEAIISVSVSQHSRLKIVFDQKITRASDGQLMLEAKIFAAAMKDFKKPFFPEQFRALF
jgi:acyl-CoA thioester hydrolase